MLLQKFVTYWNRTLIALYESDRIFHYTIKSVVSRWNEYIIRTESHWEIFFCDMISERVIGRSGKGRDDKNGWIEAYFKLLICIVIFGSLLNCRLYIWKSNFIWIELLFERLSCHVALYKSFNCKSEISIRKEIERFSSRSIRSSCDGWCC